MTLLLAIAVNLVSALIGAGAVYLYERYVRNRRSRIARWWWNPLDRSVVQVFVGARDGLVADELFEGFFSASDAEVIGRLKLELREYFDKVVLVQNMEKLDWDQAIVSVGGPVTNSLFRGLNASRASEYRFDIDDRTLINMDGTQRFENAVEGANGPSVSHALIAKHIVRAEGSRTSIVSIAGTYGPATLEAAIYLADSKNLKQLHLVSHQENNMQAVLRIVSDGDVASSSLSVSVVVDSVDRRNLLKQRAAEPS
jgi:hypothetical protein